MAECLELKKYAMNLADLLYPGEELLDSAIGRASGDLYNEFLQKVYQGEKVFERSPAWRSLVTDA